MALIAAFASLLLLSMGQADGKYSALTVGKNDPRTQQWWKRMSIYNVYPKSFKDSDGDGLGDLKGIAQKVQHFVDLGVDIIWLNPFFESPGVDHGYDISNFTKVEPKFGTLDDFMELMRELKKAGIKFMMDFIANHCSASHIWFQKSKENIKPYSDYFIWKDPKGYDANGKPIPPNNWLSVFGNSSWAWVKSRKQFYYHAFAVTQPDFNLTNPLVMEELKNILRFWLDRGVSGIRVDAPRYFVEDARMRDQPYVMKEAEERKSMVFEDMLPIYITDLQESYDIIYTLRKFIEEEYTLKDGEDRVMIVEIALTSRDIVHKWMDYAHLSFNFEFQTVPYFFNAKLLDTVIHSWDGYVSTYTLETHDNSRIATYFGEDCIDVINIIFTMLPGSLCVYYGQEIGMMEPKIRSDQITDKTRPCATRDGTRTPMQWDDSKNAGFTTKHKPWLPVHPNYWRVNLAKEKETHTSHYHVFKSLMKLRKTPTWLHGNLTTYVLSEWIWAFTRRHLNETYVIIINSGSESETVDLSGVSGLPKYLKVLVPTINAGYQPGEFVLSELGFKHSTILRPRSGLVLSTNIDHQQNVMEETKDKQPPRKSNALDLFNHFSVLIFFTSLFLLFCK